MQNRPLPHINIDKESLSADIYDMIDDDEYTTIESYEDNAEYISASGVYVIPYKASTQQNFSARFHSVDTSNHTMRAAGHRESLRNDNVNQASSSAVSESLSVNEDNTLMESDGRSDNYILDAEIFDTDSQPIV